MIAASETPSAQRWSAIRGQNFMRMTRRAFGFWRQRRHAWAALSGMTARDLADIGLTACDRAMALETRDWHDPDNNRNVAISAYRRSRIE
jgi:uncharacterized protein YjiS (DUF1127 family)